MTPDPMGNIRQKSQRLSGPEMDDVSQPEVDEVRGRGGEFIEWLSNIAD